MDNKKFANRVTVLVLINLLVKLIWILFIERKVQLSVGFQDFGLYYSVFSFTLILGVINDPGLNNYLIQYLSKGKTQAQHITELFYLKTLLAGLYILIGYSLGLLIGFKDYNLLGLLMLYQILYSFLNYLRGFLKGNQLLGAEVFVSVLDKSLLIVALLPVLYINNHFNWTVNFYIIAQLIALGLALVFCIYYLYSRKIKVFPQKNSSVNFSLITKIAPFAVFTFLVLAYNKIDTVMLAKMLPNGDEQTGIYVAAYRFLDASSMLPILFATLFYPILCNNISDKVKVSSLVSNSLSVLLPVTLIVATTSWFYRTQLMDLLYHEKNSQQLSLIFGILMLSLPLIVIYYVFSTVFTANNQLKTLNLISAGGLLVNIALNILLIPVLQALGAAISSLVSFLLVGLAYVILYHIRFKHLFKTSFWVKLFLFCLLLSFLGFVTISITQHWILNLTLYFIIATALAFVFQFLRIKNIKDVIGLKL